MKFAQLLFILGFYRGPCSSALRRPHSTMCQSLLVLLSLYLSSLSPAFPPARVSFEPVHCHVRRIYIVNAHPVECAGFSCNCGLEMACWLFPGLSHAYCISWRHASVSGGRRQGAPTLFKKHAAGMKGSCFAHCTVGGETLFLHKCK